MTTDYSLQGFVNFVENRVDPNSSTMRIRGEFANPLEANGSVRLTAGLFGRVQLDLGSPYPALLVLERAIQSDQDQKFLYIVNDKKEVERRDVRLGQLENGLRVITSGLQPSDRVIINGLQRVRPGVVVKSRREAPMTIPTEPEAGQGPTAAAAKNSKRYSGICRLQLFHSLTGRPCYLASSSIDRSSPRCCPWWS